MTKRNLMLVLLVLVAVVFAASVAFGVPLPNPIRGYNPLRAILAAFFR